MPTIKEVARKARVSVGTVSNVVSGTVPVSKRLKDRVLEAVKLLDYHPDHVARSLKIRQTRTLGLVISDITDPLFPQVMRGAEDAALDANYILITFNSDGQHRRELEVLNALRSRRVDGILLAATPGSDAASVRAIHDSGTPVVCLDREIDGLGLDCVALNHFAAARDCVRHMAAQGHGRIALLNGDPAINVNQERHSGYRQGLEDTGLRFDQRLIASAGFGLDEARTAAARLLDSAGTPCAVIAGSTMLGLALLRVIRERNLRCPEDVAVAVFDDPIFSEVIAPPLTAIVQPAYELGRRGVDLLLHRMHDPKGRPSKIVLEPALRIRESSAFRSDPVARA